MRRKHPAALVLLPLSACSAESEEARFDRFRDALSDAAVTVEAEVTARDGDAVTAFTLRCTETPDGCDLEVLAPGEIAGVRAHTDGDAVEMAFDDVILPMPQAPDTVSPLLALPTVLRPRGRGTSISSGVRTARSCAGSCRTTARPCA